MVWNPSSRLYITCNPRLILILGNVIICAYLWHANWILSSMLAYKLTLIFSILAFMWIVDIYSWQGVKTVLQKRNNTHIKRIRYFYFGVAILLSVLLVLSFASAKLETNMLYRTYVSSFIFIIYLSLVNLILCFV